MPTHSQAHGLGPLKLIGFLESAGWAAFFIYFPIYLGDAGLSNFQIGVVVAAPTLVGMFSGPIWGALSDYLGRRKPFMIQSAVSTSVFIFLAALTQSFSWLLVLGLLRGLFTPVLEGLTVTNLFSLSGRGKMGRVFGGYATWKSLGWAFSAMMSGALSQLLGVRTTLYLSSLMFILIAAAALSIPDPAVSLPRGESGFSVSAGLLRVALSALRAPKLLLFLLASLPVYLAINAMMTFFPIYLEAVGAAPVLVGAVFTVPVFFEALIFSRIGRIADVAGGKRRLLVISSAAHFLLFLLTGIFRNPLILFLVYSALDPVAWPPLFTASSTFISQMLPPERWAIGQTLYNIWAWSLSPVLGSLIGGWVSDLMGFPAMFILISGLAALSCALFTQVRES